jgi:tetratricopeptide (TPR) repeat protein
LRHDLLQYLVPFYEQLVEQRQDDPVLKADQGQAWSSLAMLRQEMGDSQRARSDYEQVLAIFGQLAKDFPTVPQYRQNLAKGHNNLGGLLLQLGKRNEAEAAYRDALSGVWLYLRCRILARIRRFFRPTLRRPLLFLMSSAFREWPSFVLSGTTTLNKTLLSLVNQDVRDSGGASHSELATRCGIPGCQILQLLPARWRSEQQP